MVLISTQIPKIASTTRDQLVKRICKSASLVTKYLLHGGVSRECGLHISANYYLQTNQVLCAVYAPFRCGVAQGFQRSSKTGHCSALSSFPCRCCQCASGKIRRTVPEVYLCDYQLACDPHKTVNKEMRRSCRKHTVTLFEKSAILVQPQLSHEARVIQYHFRAVTYNKDAANST